MVTTSAPFISFLTTAYQTERYVGEMIESVLAQTRADWELIVVDNGNSDEMASVVGRFTHDPRITLIRQENKGIRGGVTAAADAAVGRYMCVLNSDDLLQPNFCERVGAMIDADPSIDAVGCDAELFKPIDDGMPAEGYFDSVGRRSLPPTCRPVSLSDLLEHGVPLYIGAIRRETWDDNDGYDPPTPGVEPDVLLWLRLAASHDIRILADRLARIRVRPGSSSRDPARAEEFEGALLGAFLAISDYCPVATDSVYSAKVMRRMRYCQAMRRARWAFRDGDVETARNAARDAYRHQRTLRAAAVTVALHVSPRFLRMIQPVKTRAQNAWGRSGYRLAHGGAR